MGTTPLRMQLNSYYKLLSVSCRACYSCKGQCYREGCTKPPEGKADYVLLDRMMGYEYVLPPGVHFSVVMENRIVCDRHKQGFIFHWTCQLECCVFHSPFVYYNRALLWCKDKTYLKCFSIKFGSSHKVMNCEMTYASRNLQHYILHYIIVVHNLLVSYLKGLNTKSQDQGADNAQFSVFTSHNKDR